MTMVVLALVAASGAQYRCDWSVVSMGGGETSTGDCRQTARLVMQR